MGKPAAAPLAEKLWLKETRNPKSVVHMSMLVDANIYLAVILDEPEKIKIIELTQGADLISPIVLPFEIGNALSAMHKRKRLDNRMKEVAADLGIHSLEV